MTKCEAYENLKDYLDNVFHNSNDYETYCYLRDCADTLAPPDPDPDTGLVPCGCGGALKFERFNDGFFDLERIACECGIEITSGPGFCKPAWNRAMGWREGNEN